MKPNPQQAPATSVAASTWLNYHHLHYFWLAVKEGTVAAAARKLRLSPPTLSAQIHALEESLNQKLLVRRGRTLVLTEAGQVAWEHADAIFARGRELVNALNEERTSAQKPLAVGIEDGLSKWITYRLLEPVLGTHAAQVVCTEDTPRVLLQQLGAHRLDVVLAAAPADPRFKVKAFNHRLGSSTLTVFAAPQLHRELAPRFPQSLHGAPMVVHTLDSATRRKLDGWLLENNLHPRLVAQVQDSALIKVMGHSGVGAFVAPTVIRAEIETQYQVRAVGELSGLQETYFAITAERRIRHPALAAITQQARSELLAP